MSIAAIVGVPIFVLSNLLVAWRLSERGASETPALTCRGHVQAALALSDLPARGFRNGISEGVRARHSR